MSKPSKKEFTSATIEEIENIAGTDPKGPITRNTNITKDGFHLDNLDRVEIEMALEERFKCDFKIPHDSFTGNSDEDKKAETVGEFVDVLYKYMVMNDDKDKATENLSVIVDYLESHPENKSAVVDFLKQDPWFDKLTTVESDNELINKLQTVVSTESSRISSDFVVGNISVSIAGKQHRLKISVAGSSWPTAQFNGFNKFIEKSEAALKTGLESHRKDLYDYLDFESCKKDKLPEPSFDNFKKMIKLDHLVVSSKGCVICGEMPWDREHGIGILIDPSGSVNGLTDYHSAYDKLV